VKVSDLIFLSDVCGVCRYCCRLPLVSVVLTSYFFRLALDGSTAGPHQPPGPERHAASEDSCYPVPTTAPRPVRRQPKSKSTRIPPPPDSIPAPARARGNGDGVEDEDENSPWARGAGACLYSSFLVRYFPAWSCYVLRLCVSITVSYARSTLFLDCACALSPAPPHYLSLTDIIHLASFPSLRLVEAGTSSAKALAGCICTTRERC
jgi:hypothetical protein